MKTQTSHILRKLLRWSWSLVKTAAVTAIATYVAHILVIPAIEDSVTTVSTDNIFFRLLCGAIVGFLGTFMISVLNKWMLAEEVTRWGELRASGWTILSMFLTGACVLVTTRGTGLETFSSIILAMNLASFGAAIIVDDWLDSCNSQTNQVRDDSGDSPDLVNNDAEEIGIHINKNAPLRRSPVRLRGTRSRPADGSMDTPPPWVSTCTP